MGRDQTMQNEKVSNLRFLRRAISAGISLIGLFLIFNTVSWFILKISYGTTCKNQQPLTYPPNHFSISIPYTKPPPPPPKKKNIVGLFTISMTFRGRWSLCSLILREAIKSSISNMNSVSLLWHYHSSTHPHTHFKNLSWEILICWLFKLAQCNDINICDI